MKKHLHFCILSMLFGCTVSFSQNNSLSLNDSLAGFDEKSLIDAAPYRGITAEEMPVYLSVHKREFIHQKYNIKPIEIPHDYSMSAKTTTAACVNEDFEEASLTSTVPGTINITTSNAVNGWTVAGGSNSSYGTTGNCTNTSIITGVPNSVQLIAPGPAGLIDPIIGPSYPIYSVFGDATVSYPASTSINGFNCYGDWFIKLNNSTPGSSVHQITKNFVVTPSNVIFNFAYIVVAMNGHCCCDNGAVSILFKDCLGNMLATVSQYSITTPAGTGCSPMGICSSPSTITSVPASTAGYYYNKWANSSINLTTWLGQCITVQVTAMDCPYAGHAGYAYFDAQCAPTIVNGIGSINNKADYKLYPNPNSGNFNIDISKAITNGELELHNILGLVVYKQPVKQGNNQIRIDNLPKGIYSYSVYDNKKVVSVGKIIIE